MTARVKVEVVDEGIKRGCPDAEIVGQAFRDGWLKVETLSTTQLKQAQKLSEGEGISLADAEVILLSEKKKALFLSDDTALSVIATMYGLKTWDTWNLLLEASSKNLITVPQIEEATRKFYQKLQKRSKEAKNTQKNWCP